LSGALRPLRAALARPGQAWTAVAAAFAIVALVAQAAPAAALDWRPALAWQQPWRWWSAAFVHWSTLHLAANLAGCAVVGAFGRAAALRPSWALAWLTAWPLTQLALLVDPRLVRYGGLSGVLHAGVAVAALALAWQGHGRARWIGALVLIGLAAKVLAERPWGEPLRDDAAWDIALAPLGHATGLVAGFACALVAGGVAAATSPRASARDNDA
jgi:rhomboid family GlyGly-CTERM serine protease